MTEPATPTASAMSVTSMTPALPRTAPVIGLDNQFWWDGAAIAELRIQECADCGRLRHPPGPMCPACHSLNWHHRRASGRGTVHSYTVHHARFADLPNPYLVALIDLEEGVRVVSNLVDIEPAAVCIGLPVEVVFRHSGGAQTIPLFRPAATGARPE